jgi:hypothetical protein
MLHPHCHLSNMQVLHPSLPSATSRCCKGCNVQMLQGCNV